MSGHPKDRFGYLAWLAGRIEGHGNENLEPIRSLVADGLVEVVEKPLSTPTRITPKGRVRLAGAVMCKERTL